MPQGFGLIDDAATTASGRSILELEREINKLVLELATAQQEAQEAHVRFDEMADEIVDLEDQVENLTVRNDVLDEERVNLVYELEQRSQNLRDSQEEYELASNDLESANETILRLEDGVSQLTVHAEDAIDRNRASIASQMRLAAILVQRLLLAIDAEDAARSAGAGIEQTRKARVELVAGLVRGYPGLWETGSMTGSRVTLWMGKTVLAEALRVPFLELEWGFMNLSASMSRVSDDDLRRLWNVVRETFGLDGLDTSQVAGKRAMLLSWATEMST